jgi:type I restriction enzyme, R subunit
MASISELDIEKLTIRGLQALGFNHIYGSEIAPDGINPARESFSDVILLNQLRDAVIRINPSLPIAALDEAIKTVQRIRSPELLANNEAFHRLLTEGVNVSYQKDGNTRGDLVWLVDFANPHNNEFVVINQFTIIENNQNKRPDLILFVNGLPLVVIELKNAADENTTLNSAYRQIETYKTYLPLMVLS